MHASRTNLLEVLTSNEKEIIELSKEKVDIQSPFAWSELWKIIYLKEYNKNLCELSEQEVSEYYGKAGANGSIQKFVNWYINEYKR